MLLATVVTVMLLVHSAPTPSEHSAHTASAHVGAHLCDDPPHPEEAAGHYWTRAGHGLAPVSRASSAAADTSTVLTESAASKALGHVVRLWNGALRPAASRQSELQVFRC